MKVLTLDIETSPILADVWSIWQQNVGLSQIRKSGQVICWAAKWYGEKKVEFRSDFHDGHEAMVARAHELFDEADAIISYNGTTFDSPWLRAEFVEAGLLPPSPHKEIDLLRVVKKNFRFPSNKLQYVSTKLGLEGKVQHSGHDLWVKCMAGDDAAWRRMRQYNIQDVRLTEKLYDRLLPWVHNHPHRGLFDGNVSACQNCGSKHLQRRGESVTTVGAFPRYQCQDCGKWSRGAKRERGVDERGVQ